MCTTGLESHGSCRTEWTYPTSVSLRFPTCQALNCCVLLGVVFVVLLRIYTKWVPEAISKQFVPGLIPGQRLNVGNAKHLPRWNIRQLFFHPIFWSTKLDFLRVEWIGFQVGLVCRWLAILTCFVSAWDLDSIIGSIRAVNAWHVFFQANFVVQHQLFPFQLMGKKVRILEEVNDSMHIGTKRNWMDLDNQFNTDFTRLYTYHGRIYALISHHNVVSFKHIRIMRNHFCTICSFWIPPFCPPFFNV